MAQNSGPITPRFAKGVSASITAAQTDQSGATGANIVTVYTYLAASANDPGAGMGGQWLYYRVRGAVTSAAAIVNLYRNVGGTRFLIASVVVPAVTVGNIVAPFDSGYVSLPPVYMAPGDKIDALSTIAQQTIVDVGIAEF